MMPGMVQAAEKILELPARHGLPQNVMGLADVISHPTYATAVGLLNFQSMGDWARNHKGGRRSGASLVGHLKSLLSDFF
jgi:cell division protein FtsA